MIFSRVLCVYTSSKSCGAFDSLSEFLRGAVPVGFFPRVLLLYTSSKSCGASDSLKRLLREVVLVCTRRLKITAHLFLIGTFAITVNRAFVAQRVLRFAYIATEQYQPVISIYH